MSNGSTEVEPTPGGSFSTNTKWRAIGTGASNGVRYVVYLLLSAILGPAEMGRMALTIVVVDIFDSLKGAGVGQLIIQRRNLPDSELHSISTLQLLIVGLLSTGILLSADLLAAAMGDPTIASVIRCMVVAFALSGVSFVNQSTLMREARFEVLAKIEVVSVAAYACTSLPLAFSGLGIWSIVIGHAVRESVAFVGYRLASKYRARLRWDKAVIRDTVGFASNIVGSTVLHAVMSRVDQILVGRLLGTEALGVYALAKRLIIYPMQVVSRLFNAVLLPSLSRMGEDRPSIQRLYLRVCSALGVIAFPVAIGLTVVAEPFTRAALDSRWDQVSDFILCLSPAAVILVLTTTTTSLFISQARPGLLFKLSLVHHALISVAYAIAASISVIWLPVAESTVVTIMAYPTFAMAFRLVGLRVYQLLKAVHRPFFCAITMGLLVRAVVAWSDPHFSAWTVLSIGCVVGALSYLAAMWMVGRAELLDVWKAVTKRMGDGHG